MIRILLADDHDLLRRGLCSLLAEHDGWEVCGEARDGHEAVSLAAELRPHIAILDIAMPGLDGLEATRRIRQDAPETEVLIFTMHETRQLVLAVLETGARGYLLKSDAAEQLVAAVEALLRHETYFSPPVSKALLERFLDRDRGQRAALGEGQSLTAREREVLVLVAEGRSNREIADQLAISIKTVETHRSSLMRKLDLHSVAELVRYAIRDGVVEL